jgi:hypothetical protein
MEVLFHERLHGLPLVPGHAFQLPLTHPDNVAYKRLFGVYKLHILENQTFNILNNGGACMLQSPNGQRKSLEENRLPRGHEYL